MKIETFNIRHGGGPRVSSILKSIEKHDPDIVLLTEFRNNVKGETLKSELFKLGYTYQVNGIVGAKVNTLLLASKVEFLDAGFKTNLGDHSHRLLVVTFPYFTIVGFYFPQRLEKIPVFNSLIEVISENKNQPIIALGDLNTGKHYSDEKGSSFYAAEYMAELEKICEDAWRKFHGPKQEYSWYSNKGNGFRIDHAFVTRSMSNVLTNVWYSHAEREGKISDHSALILEFNENEFPSCP